MKSFDMYTHSAVSLDSLLASFELTDFSVYRSAEEGRNDKEYPTCEGGVRMSAEGKPTVDERKQARRTSRREYLCLAAGLAVGAGATYLVMPKPPEETFSGKGATKVKITVLRTIAGREIYPEGLPVKPKYGACDYFEEGQEFYVDAKRPQMPREKFCPYAWEALFPFAWRVYESGRLGDWYGEWMSTEQIRVYVGVCPDGLIPVTFKLEWI